MGQFSEKNFLVPPMTASEFLIIKKAATLVI